MPKIFIGTSGWNYPHWKDGVFYPAGLPAGQWLEYYAQVFNAVEINVTFYRNLKGQTFKNWYARVPKKFYFVVKGNRYITHIKRFNSVKEELKAFFKNASFLKEKLAAILWQLPPGFKKDLNALKNFLNLLSMSKKRQVFEFRNVTWFDKDIYALLNKYNACLCIAHSQRFPCVKEITADFLYLRFHGADSLYSSNYPDAELQQWAKFAKKTNLDVCAFFNNDAEGFAVKNALRFKEFLEK